MMKALLTEQRGVTAIFAANDATAFGALQAIQESGLSVPEDISLIGFDNVPVAGLVHPPLTTVHQPKYEMGQAAMEILIRQARSRNYATEQRILGVRLVERKSCRAITGR
jgi:LacI family transcriptional regulator